ncbi:MAG: tetratricopeptide repeat protein [Sedimentisphaerales bacterium]|nr:tetratricopeptide repeat protein [Sedimentisphaerales bacterium]
MVSAAEAQVHLFGEPFPSLDGLNKLNAYVNSSELRKQKFVEQIEKNQSNALAAGVGLEMIGEPARALDLLSKAPDCKEKFLYQGYAQRTLGHYDQALSSLDKAVKQHADSLLIAMEKVATFRMAARFDEAIAELQACSNYEKVSAEFHYQRGRLANAQGQYDEAIADFQIAVELDPHHTEALFHLAFALDLRGEDEAAIDYYRQAVKSPPIRVNALLNLAVLYEDQEEYERAWACVEAVLDSHPNHAKARLFLKDIESSKTMVYDEEKAKRQDRHAKILEIPLTDFELSVRSRNCLKKMNLNTLGDMLRITEAELLSYKNFGETSLLEIKRILDMKGLRLGMALESSAGNLSAQAFASGASEEVLNKSVDELELNVRSRRCLTRLNVRTLGELIMRTEAELLGCKNFGVTSLNEIKERLNQFGLSLRKLE